MTNPNETVLTRVFEQITPRCAPWKTGLRTPQHGMVGCPWGVIHITPLEVHLGANVITLLNVRMCLVYGPRVDDALRERLLAENAHLWIGWLGINSDGDIVVCDTVWASPPDPDRLMAVIKQFAVMAQQRAPQLASETGGKTAQDHFDLLRRQP